MCQYSSNGLSKVFKNKVYISGPTNVLHTYTKTDKKDTLKFQGMCQVIALPLWVSFCLTLRVRTYTCGNNFSVRRPVCMCIPDGWEKN